MHILALRQLEELQNGSELENMTFGKSAFDWAKYYYLEVIPSYQSMICSTATNKFNEWLYSVRDLSPVIGQFALAQAASVQVFRYYYYFCEYYCP